MKCKQQQQNANEIAVAILSATHTSPLSLLDFLYLSLSPCLSCSLRLLFCCSCCCFDFSDATFTQLQQNVENFIAGIFNCKWRQPHSLRGVSLCPSSPSRHPLTHFCSPSCCLFLLAPANFQFSLHFACYPYPCHRHLYAVYWPISFYIFPSSALPLSLSWSYCICIQHRPTN